MASSKVLNWCIYVLRCPRTREVRYVGFTSREIQARLRVHISESITRQSRTRKHSWILSIINAGLRPVIEIVETGSGDGWKEAERRWITALRAQGAQLTNSTDGGEGVIGWGTPEQRTERNRKTKATMGHERLSESARKRNAAMTPEQRSEKQKKASATLGPEGRSAAKRKANASRTPELRREVSRKGIAAWMAQTTFEQRSEAIKQRWAAKTSEERREIAIKRWATRKERATARVRFPDDPKTGRGLSAPGCL